MKIMKRAVVAAVILWTAACQQGSSGENAANSAAERDAVAPVLNTPDAVDIHSFAKPLIARVTHVALDLNVDFDTRRLGGTATLDIQKRPDAREIILDDRGL